MLMRDGEQPKKLSGMLVFAAVDPGVSRQLRSLVRNSNPRLIGDIASYDGIGNGFIAATVFVIGFRYNTVSAISLTASASAKLFVLSPVLLRFPSG